MNKVLLLGRLTRDPEVRYSQSAEPIAIARFSLAVNRRFKREGEPDADFINCVALGKQGEFVEKYLKKGHQITVVGRITTRSYDDQQTGQRKYITEVTVEEIEFAESKAAFEARMSSGGGDAAYAQPKQYSNNPAALKPKQPAKQQQSPEAEGFYPIDENIDDDDLPF